MIAAGMIIAALAAMADFAVADDAPAIKAKTPEKANPVLIFEEPDDGELDDGELDGGELDEVERFSLSTLKKRLPLHKLKFFDPLYKKEKRYAAFALHDVFRLSFGDRWRSDEYSDVAFVALDGYKALGSLAAIKEKGAYLVYEDLDQDGWEPLGKRKIDPAPFYIVWTGKDQGPKGIYPWPYQLERIQLVQFKEQYPKVVPVGVAKGSAVFRGYQLFRSTCFACHAMSRQGGMVGPDLNAPQNITEYREEKMIRAFIRAPSQFRYSKMPDNPKLTDEDLDHLLAYFRHMARRKGE